MNPSFIQIHLCDNDYGQQLEQAAKLLQSTLADDILVSEARIKRVMVDLVVALSDLQSAARGFEFSGLQTSRYLDSVLHVSFSRHPPTRDHDGGSVAINRHTGHVWRF